MTRHIEEPNRQQEQEGSSCKTVLQITATFSEFELSDYMNHTGAEFLTT